MDLLRHWLGLPCRRLAADHAFEPLSWDPRCGYIPEPKPYRNRCMLPRRCHHGVR